MKHVLLIDDNAIDNYISKTIIAKRKIAEKIPVMISAIDSLAFLEILTAEEFPDIIFLDIRMPEMDGFGFLEIFSSLPIAITANTSVFMLTSSSDPADIERSKKYSFVKKYFSKPMSDEILDELTSKL